MKSHGRNYCGTRLGKLDGPLFLGVPDPALDVSLLARVRQDNSTPVERKIHIHVLWLV